MDAIQEKLPRESRQTWQNASIVAIVDKCAFVIQAGMGQSKFTSSFDEKGNARVKRIDKSMASTFPKDTPVNRRVTSTPRHHKVKSVRPKSSVSGRTSAVRSTHQYGDMSADFDDEQQHYHLPCEEINKRAMGKAVLKFCGNEGTDDCKNKATLRRLLQAVISHIPEEKGHIWRDAEVKIYDDECDVYTITAGKGHHKFVATFDGLGNPKVVRPKHGSECALM